MNETHLRNYNHFFQTTRSLEESPSSSSISSNGIIESSSSSSRSGSNSTVETSRPTSSDTHLSSLPDQDNIPSVFHQARATHLDPTDSPSPVEFLSTNTRDLILSSSVDLSEKDKKSLWNSLFPATKVPEKS